MRILWFEIYSLIVEFSYVKKNLVIFGHHSVKNEEAQSFGGTMFFAGVHDFGAIWASVRNKGTSVGSLTGDVVGPRARTLFMIVIFLLLLMVNAVFAVAISNALVATPSAVIPVWSAIAVAVVVISTLASTAIVVAYLVSIAPDHFVATTRYRTDIGIEWRHRAVPCAPLLYRVMSSAVSC